VERGVSLELERPGAPLRVGVDPELAARTLQPVVENAVRYGRAHVRLSVARNGTRVVFLVEDEGPGVHVDEREVIFVGGHRGAAGQDGDVDGAGLGLALARRLARAASGDVEALSSEDGGRFAVSLPRV
jgi:signal transduction histidine kinase